MKRFFSFVVIFSLLIFILVGCSNKEQTSNENSTNTSSAERTSTNVSVEDNIQNNTITNEIHLGAFENEEELASFSTKLGGKDTPRSRNIALTTSILNETVVKPGETFSFCNTIGKPTADRGYEEADSFDADGNTIKTYGGGNCQVSSTLYNVVLQIPELKVTERHAHIKPVHYVAKDKDATVAYGSVDFKFKNNTESDIKIYASSDLKSVNVRIVKTD